ncbi:pyridoxal-dependent decarboxylase [Actinoallomurus sp. CA-142502]|uniref:pyridoxal-dependent decarboxylase n=1 Tax=Actinoallomurus sp. CA-142502 TaxID=3239885 RepID=UPI003D8C0547
MALKHSRRGGRSTRDLEVNPLFSQEPVTVPRYALPPGRWTRRPHMPARLWHAPDPRRVAGCSTTGSSEAASAVIAPFLDSGLVWDFRLPRVASINTSGHKYGLVMPGLGWALWRDADALPDDLVFHVNDLGGQMPTFALNFSRPGAQVIAQYYNFLRLGFDGYRRVQRTCRDVAVRLAGRIAALGPFELITDGGEAPVFAFRLRPEITNFTVFGVLAALREYGRLVPAYTFPPDRTDLSVLRIVVRNGAFAHGIKT